MTAAAPLPNPPETIGQFTARIETVSDSELIQIEREHLAAPYLGSYSASRATAAGQEISRRKLNRRL
jgi:hypothetical protein